MSTLPGPDTRREVDGDEDRREDRDRGDRRADHHQPAIRRASASTCERAAPGRPAGVFAEDMHAPFVRETCVRATRAAPPHRRTPKRAGVLSLCGALARGAPILRGSRLTISGHSMPDPTRRRLGPASCSSTRCASEATRSAGRPAETSRSPCSTRTPRRAATSSTRRTPTRPGSTGNRGGESETIIGEWLARGPSTDDLIIATKVGSGAEDVPRASGASR